MNNQIKKLSHKKSHSKEASKPKEDINKTNQIKNTIIKPMTAPAQTEKDAKNNKLISELNTRINTLLKQNKEKDETIKKKKKKKVKIKIKKKKKR